MPVSGPRTASAVTRAFFCALKESGLATQEVAFRSGNHINSFYNWKTGKASAGILNLEAALAVLGLELAIRPINLNPEEEP